MKIIPFDIALREQIQSEENHYQGRYKVQTRNGDDVKIIYWDRGDKRNGEYPIVGLQIIDGIEFITTCTKDGKYTLNAGPNNNDLVLIDTWEPELKESEDERVRKAILGLVYLDGIEPILTKCSVTRSDILSYLEKQKEQKPAEWNEEDKHRCGDAIYFLETAKKHYADTSEIELTIDWLKSLRPQPKDKQKSEEWSEEVDDDTRKRIKEVGLTQQQVDWLKKGRTIFGQREEEPKHTEVWVEGRTIFEQEGKPNNWKPTKEQLGYLSKAIATLAEEGDGKTAAVLNELRKDLKNL